jgi:hypothetical protein
MAITIQHGIAPSETRGRPPCDEVIALLKMQVGDSFVSPKRRGTLYQLARNTGVKIRIMKDANSPSRKPAWRVWKMGVYQKPNRQE